MKLKDKVAIVTGASKGIGKAISLRFAREGASVVVVGRNLERMKNVVKEIEAIGQEAIVAECDVSNATDVSEMVKAAVNTFHKIDILVNNAGIFIPESGFSEKSLLETTEEEWDRAMNTNVKSVFLCAKNVVPVMLKTGKGKIINLSSILGQVGQVNCSVYCATKGAIINLTRALALELAPKINVNCIAPGLIETDMTKLPIETPEIRKTFIEKTPLGRIGRPEDIASMAVFLASDESNFITGAISFVDGGWTAQ